MFLIPRQSHEVCAVYVMHLDGRQKRFLSSLGLYAALSQNEGYVFNSPSSPLFTDQGVFWT